MKLFKILRLTLLALSLAMLAWSGWRYYGKHSPVSGERTTVMELPVEFTYDREFGGDFNVDIDTRYRVSLIFHRLIPANILDSLVGGTISTGSQSRRRITLPISLSLWQNDSLLLKTDSVVNESYSNTANYVGRFIESFKGVKNKRYFIKARITQTIPQLNQTQPLLRVTVIPSIIKQQYVNSAVDHYMIELWFKISCVLFFLMLSFNLVVVFKSRLTTRSS